MPAFRHDINGLRALAVTCVVLFHFRVPGFSAGYLGVDIFFVISGFLMAAILMRGLENNQAKWGGILWAFYMARARRIVPALVALVMVLLSLGWWALSAGDYAQLARHAQHALGFSSNHRFWEEAGYFDVASHEKWLLHTWSLSVEWQFYLLLPLGLIGLWRIRRSRVWLTTAVSIALLVSLLFSGTMTERSPEAAFYLLPMRAWELLAGVMVYLLADRVRWDDGTRRAMEIAGLALLLLAVITFDVRTPWPGTAALLPVGGTALVLLAMRHAPGWATPAPVHWLGQVSYSLYLWHWPAFVALVYLDLQQQPWAVAAALLLALGLAGASYRFVEQPARRGLVPLSHGRAVAALVVPVALVTAFAVWVKSERGLAERMPPRFNAIMAEKKNTNPHRDQCHGRPGAEAFPWCTLGGNNIRAVVIGDSHASAIATAVLEALSRDQGDGVIQATYTSCQTLFGMRKTNKRLECEAFNAFVEAKLASLPNNVPVFIGNRLSAGIFGTHLPHEKGYGAPGMYFGDSPVQVADEPFLAQVRERLIDSACRLATSRPVYWVRPIPEMPVDVPRWLARRTLLSGHASLEVRMPREEYELRNAFVTEVLHEAARRCANVHVLDPVPWLCDESHCYGSRDGLPLYYDEHHLSEHGNRELLPMFVAVRTGIDEQSIQIAGDGSVRLMPPL